MLFNINDKVKIKLLEPGIQELQRQHEELHGLFPHSIPKEMSLTLDENGYYEIQLWVLMSKLGHMIGNGQHAPFELQILIPNKRGEE